MSPENLLPIAPGEATTQPDAETEHALYGKIARLPHAIREQLNQRLYDGKSGSEILAWLNARPAVKKILAAQFDGRPVSSQNLSNWRQDGYERWLRKKDNISSTKELSQYAAEVTEAGGGRLAPAAAAMASRKILEFLQSARAACSDPNDLMKCAAAASALLKTQQNYARLDIAKERIRIQDMKLILKRDKQQRDVVNIAIRLLGDARAKEIEASDCNNAEKIEILGIHLFGDLWERRHIPPPGPPQPAGEGANG